MGQNSQNVFKICSKEVAYFVYIQIKWGKTVKMSLKYVAKK